MDEQKSEPQDEVKEPQRSEETPEPSKPASEPSAEPETFTREQMNQYLQASQGKKDKEIAALTKQVGQLQTVEERLQTATTALEKIDEERAAQELAAAEGDPDLLAQVKKRQALTAQIRADEARKAELDAQVKDNESLLATVNEAKKREHAEQYAKEFELPVETVLSFGAETPEEMRKYAENFSKALKAQNPEGKLPRPVNPAGATPPTRDLSKLSPFELAREAYGPEETANRKK